MPAVVDHRRPHRLGTAVVATVLALVTACGAAGDTAAAPRGAVAAAPTPAGRPGAPPAVDRDVAGSPVQPSTASRQPAEAARTAADVPVRSADLAALRTVEPVPPVGLALPALGVTVPVDPVGVRDDGQMQVPPRAERAGWYRFGASPADPGGTAVIAAHVDSVASAGLGPFARLRDARVGDPVEVTLADGSVRRYAVTGVERRPKPDIAWPDVFVRGGGARLVLVTCGGRFQREAGQYSDNVLVTAAPVGGP